ncbi:uncharacterized protein Nmlp_3345 [Natronomonas moolapensis 8.8.11]|uniref:Uncharacterized protein n=1 Tax=Natronomonas moolapensis (strain DSM 18674 / CECT 7526 / JCM 14361 / 8.8.11) TaxID=268739 RepID=M1XSV0_NATM8|nr:hypothetical protein [Natronomonas moolapensis]CCQ37475.1 uncharacterized protein Nmlp_3345 [Natronomonas moolapensis 8.8.11]
MGVRCALSGHLYETTEFEEHRRERPEGVVLVCREYQVCSRCGSREEMYRNEQLLTPREHMGEESAPEDVDAPEGEQDGHNSDKDSREPTEGPSEHADSTDPDWTLEEVSRPEDNLGGETSGSSVATNGHSSSTTDERDDTDRLETTAEGSSGLDSLPGGAVATEPDVDDADEAERANRLEAPENEPTKATDHRFDPESRANTAGRTENTRSPPNEDVTADTASDEPTDDAVIISEADDTTPSTDEHDDGDGTGLRCQACGGTWDGATTSLREGDLCPECRRGYVEARSGVH